MCLRPPLDRASQRRSGTSAQIARGIRAAKRISLVMDAFDNFRGRWLRRSDKGGVPFEA